MSISTWMRRNEFTPQQYNIARGLLMTGPRATPPTWRAIKKTMCRLRRGDKPGPHGYSPWRQAARIAG